MQRFRKEKKTQSASVPIAPTVPTVPTVPTLPTVPTVKSHVSEKFIFNTSVCVCIPLHNVAEISNNILQNIELLKSWFHTSFFCFINYDSNDNTYQLFNSIPNSVLLNTHNTDISKIHNMFLKFVYDNKQLFEHMMVIDPFISLRFQLNQTSFDFFSLKSDVSWNAMFANQTYKYYDIGNLVSDDIVTPFPVSGSTDDDVSLNQLHIPSNLPLIPVKSAFGGLAVYKTIILDENDKYTTDYHKTFNLTLSSKFPDTFFINPKFLIETHPANAHLYV